MNVSKLFCLTAILVLPLVGQAATDVVAANIAPTEASHEEILPPAKFVVDAGAPGGRSATEAEPIQAATAPAIPSKEEVAKLPEHEIPVLTGAKQAKRAEGGNISRILATLGVLTVVIGGAFFALKRWAGRSGPAAKSPKIKVLTQHTLGPKKSLAIIQVAGESILIGVTDHNISMLKTLSLIDDEVPEAVPAHFGNTLSEFEDEEAEAYAGDRDDFAVKGLREIRDKVSGRLKSMKSL